MERTLAQRGFGQTSKMVPTATGMMIVLCDPVPPDCPHGQYKWNCVDCGGTGKCIHDKISYHECGYSERCIHKHRRYLCKECKGGGICQHNRARYYCRECPGAGICIHLKQKSKCNDCKSIPNERCEHYAIKRCCEDCKKAALKPAALSEANLEAHDFRLEYAKDVVRSFPPKRKLSE